MGNLPRFHPFLTRALLVFEPVARGFAPISRVPLQVLRQGYLVGEVVADYPFTPGDLHPVGILPQAGQEAGLVFRGSRRWIKYLPFIGRKIDFHPTMRVARANDVVAAQVVVFAREEAIDFTRRNSERAQHDGHCRSKVFAVARASLEKKMSERIVPWFPGQI